MQKIRKKVGVLDERKEEFEILKQINDDNLEFQIKKEKNDFIIKILLIALAFVWIIGYYLLPPIGNYISGNSNTIYERSDINVGKN